jgi:hypothetical protein
MHLKEAYIVMIFFKLPRNLCVLFTQSPLHLTVKMGETNFPVMPDLRAVGSSRVFSVGYTYQIPVREAEGKAAWWFG